MTWVAPRTWVTGEVVTSSQLNTHVRDNLLSVEHPHDAVETAEEGVINSTTETSLFTSPPTIAAGELGSTGQYRCLMMGRARQGTTASLNWQWRVYLGATAIVDVNNNGGASTSTEGQWWLEFFIVNLGSESSQRVFIRGAFSGQYASLPTLYHTTSAVDTTAAKTFDVTVKMGTAGANNYAYSNYRSQTLKEN